MSITLSDAIGRAELISEEEGHLKQESYNMLIRSLSKEDVYPFTMAIVERDIGVRTGSSNGADTEIMKEIISENRNIEDVDENDYDISSKFSIIAQRFVQKEDDGLWVPEEYDVPVEEEDPQLSLELDEVEEITEEDIEEEWTTQEYEELQNIGDFQEKLESSGISINSDGTVSFYKSNLPGLYTTKNPMKPMSLDKAFQYFERSMNSVDREQTKINDLLNIISKLDSQVYDMEFTLEELGKFKYDSSSRSREIQDISFGLEEVKELINEGDWNGSQRALNELKSILDIYTESQQDKYQGSISVLETLNNLMDIQEHEPEKFKQISQGLGSLPRAAYMNERTVYIDVGTDKIKSIVSEVANPSTNEEEIYNEFINTLTENEMIDPGISVFTDVFTEIARLEGIDDPSSVVMRLDEGSENIESFIYIDKGDDWTDSDLVHYEEVEDIVESNLKLAIEVIIEEFDE